MTILVAVCEDTDFFRHDNGSLPDSRMPPLQEVLQSILLTDARYYPLKYHPDLSHTNKTQVRRIIAIALSISSKIFLRPVKR